MYSDSKSGRVHWRMHIRVPPEEVYAVLDSDEGRASFWAESAREFDGHVHFRFINGYACKSRILERDPPNILSLDYMGGPVRFELQPDGAGGTDLLLTHEDIDADEWADVHAGWLNVLFPLKAWLIHGVDLRNHDSARTWDEGYADQ